MKRVVIIGGVAAGMSAASKLRRLEEETEIIVFEKGEDISYGACGLPYYIAGTISSSDRLVARTKEEFEKQGINVYLRHEAVALSPEEKKIRVVNHTDGLERDVNYDHLVLATGASAIQPPFYREEASNVFTLKTLQDAIHMKAFFEKTPAKDVTIIGGGYIGMELVETMKTLGKHVRVIDVHDHVLTVYDEDIAHLVQSHLKEEHGIEFCLGEEVTSLTQHNGDVVAVETKTNTYQTDAVIVNVGIRPNTTFLKGSGIECLENGAILTNEYMETNLPFIYAGGDCATSYHRLLKKRVHIALGTIANKQGRLIAENIHGKRHAFQGVLGTNIVKILDLTVAKTGLSEKEAKEANIPYETETITANNGASYYPGTEELTIKLLFNKESHVIIGAQIVGGAGVAQRIDTLVAGIYNEMTADEMTYLDLCYAPPYAGVWDAIQVATNKIKK
ncbi:CoA-disulfide reductase [Priestia koreensis]|uniref:CoA-disulfide reductase n=1 Tax=Priestia koreensis TaxID=284581 RepID=UPI001F57066C|nr:CoA-disulfide reductase [Priestia koreensis]UNL85869.1 CoA-disulfide reductase [Priestia koreensis]